MLVHRDLNWCVLKSGGLQWDSNIIPPILTWDSNVIPPILTFLLLEVWSQIKQPIWYSLILSPENTCWVFFAYQHLIDELKCK